MNVVAPTVQLSTISAPEAAPAAATPPVPSDNPAPPGRESEGASAAAREEPKTDPEMGRRLGDIAKKEARARRIETELHERMSSFAEKEKAIEAKLAELDEALRDPVKYTLDKGEDPVRIAKRFAEPETDVEKEIRLLKDRETKREAAEAKRAADAQAAREEESRMGVVRTFVSEITEDNAPNLVALYPAHEVPSLVTELLNRPHIDPDTGEPSGETLLRAFQHVHGRSPTNAEIRDSLEAEAESRATKILETHRRRNGTGTPNVQASGAGQLQPPSKNGTGPSGISNTHASVTTSGKSRKPSLEEKRKAAKRELTEALEAEAHDRT
jgi:hypothetical protein